MIFRFGIQISLLCVLLLPGCWKPGALEFGTQRQAVIYGADDRKDVPDHPDAKLRDIARSVGMLVSNSSVQTDANGKVALRQRSFSDNIASSSRYGGLPLCEDEPFRDDPSAGSCTVFLIGPRLIATAGHCIQNSEAWCRSRSVVFGFHRVTGGKINDLSKDDVYRCHRVIVRKLTSQPPVLDIATFELDRDVVGRKPLDVDNAPNLKKDDPLAILGHPHGILMKIAAGAVVVNPRSGSGDYFTTNLDTYPGNSGSPVFHGTTYKVVGVHVRGARPVFVADQAKQCNRSHTLPEGGGRQSATYMVHAQEKKCKTNAECDRDQICTHERCRQRLPDLKLTRFEIAQKKALVGTPINVNFEIENAGNTDVIIKFRVGLWASENGTINPSGGADVLLDSKIFGPLSVGAKAQGTFSILAKGDVKLGKQYIGVYIDDVVSDVPSQSGAVVESSETNNYGAQEIEVSACNSTCAKEGEQRCDKTRIEICRKTTTGCLAWELLEFCPAPRLCKAGQCVKTCKDGCEFKDEARCFGQEVKICREQQSGCRDWEPLKTCSGEQSCAGGKCVDKPKPKQPLGRGCAENGDCASGLCHGQGTKICKQACATDGDCKGVPGGLQSCVQQICSAAPTPACKADGDCKAGESCRSGRCAPAQGCSGCQLSPHRPAPAPWLPCLLLLLGLRLSLRKVRP